MAIKVSTTVEFEIRKLFKDILILLDEFRIEHEDFTAKISDFLDDRSIIDLTNPMSESKKAYLRKRVLDLGNETIRRVLPLLELVDAELILKVNGNEKTKEHPHVPSNG